MPEPALASSGKHTSAFKRGVTRVHDERRVLAIVIALVLFTSLQLRGQTAPPASDQDLETNELRELRHAVRELQAQVSELKRELHDQRAGDAKPASSAADPAHAAGTAVPSPSPAAGQQNDVAEAKQESTDVLDFLRHTDIEVGVDTYYGFNFNDPIGRVNLLRAYDVSSNAFSLNQANLILKQDPDPSAGRRFGARLDLQFGQATETLQGNASNEPRPDVYRNVFQAYGTYVLPWGATS